MYNSTKINIQIEKKELVDGKLVGGIVPNDNSSFIR